MLENRIKVLEMIMEDTKNDAANFDGRPFTGKVVAEYFGNHGAAIAALADIIKSMLLEEGKENREIEQLRQKEIYMREKARGMHND